MVRVIFACDVGILGPQGLSEILSGRCMKVHIERLTTRITRVLSIMLLLLVAKQYSTGQIVKKPRSKPTPPPAATTPQPSPVQSFEGKLVSVFDSVNPKGDYVPCQFTVEQLLQLRPKPEISVISSYDEEQIKSQVLSAVLSQSNAGVFSKGQEVQFANALANASFESLTMSQALTVVITILNSATSSPEGTNAVVAATAGPEPFHNYLKGQLSPAAYAYVSSNMTATRPVDMLTQSKGLMTFWIGQQAKETGATEATKVSSSNEEPSNEKPSKGPEKLTPENPPSPDTEQKNAKTVLALEEGSQTLSEGTIAAKNSIIDSARNVIGFQRPPDVACSMAVLSWNSVRYSFGQTLANEYIAVQIVVRNMNSQQEFLVHDAEFSVDSDLLGAHGRYFSGLDKLTVRQFMLSSRDYGRRNFLVNLAQGVGTILSATSLVYAGGVADATSVYNAGFLNAVNNTWKDHNTEQLNLLNDVGFSASKTDRTVVPKSGTAMFVIFIPAKQFQTGWWTQECANVIVTSKQTSKGQEPGVCTKAQEEQGASNCVEPQEEYQRLAKHASVRTGIDLESARAICQQYYGGGTGGSTPQNGAVSEDFTDSSIDTSPPIPKNSSVTQETTTINYIKSPASVPYRKWSDSANAIFRELSFAIVAGTHLQEEQDLTPAITKMDCPKDAQGNLDLGKAANGAITCDLTGQNLDKAAKLKLRNSQNQTDTKTADGSVTTSGDPKSAKASFPLDQIAVLNEKKYKVFTVTKDGVENDSSQIVLLSSSPILSSVSTDKDATVALDKLMVKSAPSVTVTLTGYHLDNLSSVHLGSSAKEVSPGDSVSIDEIVKPKSAAEASFDFTSADAAKVPAGDYSSKPLEMYIFLVAKGGAGEKVATAVKLSGTGNVKGGSSTSGAPPSAPGPKGPALLLSLPKTTVVGTQTGLKVTVNDASGKTDAGFVGTIKVISSDKQAVLPSDYTFKQADKGVTTLRVTFKTQGSQSVTVTSDKLKATAKTTVTPPTKPVK